MPQKILHLTLKKKWFDLILSGKKKIEYREIKPYWTTRLFDKCPDGKASKAGKGGKAGKEGSAGKPKKFDVIEFRNGYAKDARKMRVEFKGVKIITLKKDVGEFKRGMRVYGMGLGDR